MFEVFNRFRYIKEMKGYNYLLNESNCNEMDSKLDCFRINDNIYFHASFIGEYEGAKIYLYDTGNLFDINDKTPGKVLFGFSKEEIGTQYIIVLNVTFYKRYNKRERAMLLYMLYCIAAYSKDDKVCENVLIDKYTALKFGTKDTIKLLKKLNVRDRMRFKNLRIC